MMLILEEVADVMAKTLAVPTENITIRQDCEYMVAEVTITTDSIGTADDMDQIMKQTQFKWDSYKINPKVGIVLIFVRKVDYFESTQ